MTAFTEDHPHATYQLCIMQGFDPDPKSRIFGKVVLPDGVCTKCGFEIEIVRT